MKRGQEEPTDTDYKFAEWAIEAHLAIYEQTGVFPFTRQLERLTDDIRKIREEHTGIRTGSLAGDRFMQRLRKSKEAAE